MFLRFTSLVADLSVSCLVCTASVAQAFFLCPPLFILRHLAAMAAAALHQLRHLPNDFQELLRTANPRIFEASWHEVDCEERFADIFEMFSGSSRISSLCQKAWSSKICVALAQFDVFLDLNRRREWRSSPLISVWGPTWIY